MDFSVEPQAPGTVLIDASTFPIPAQDLVERLYAVVSLALFHLVARALTR